MPACRASLGAGRSAPVCRCTGRRRQVEGFSRAGFYNVRCYPFLRERLFATAEEIPPLSSSVMSSLSKFLPFSLTLSKNFAGLFHEEVPGKHTSSQRWGDKSLSPCQSSRVICLLLRILEKSLMLAHHLNSQRVGSLTLHMHGEWVPKGCL